MGKRRLELEVQTETIVLRGPAPGVSWCHECEEASMKISVEHAAVLTSASEMMIYRMVEEGRLHHAETADGRLRICLQSLLAMEGTVTRIE